MITLCFLFATLIGITQTKSHKDWRKARGPRPFENLIFDESGGAVLMGAQKLKFPSSKSKLTFRQTINVAHQLDQRNTPTQCCWSSINADNCVYTCSQKSDFVLICSGNAAESAWGILNCNVWVGKFVATGDYGTRSEKQGCQIV